MIEFLNLKPKTFGLDISDFSLKIANLKKKGKFLTLASWGETTIEPGIVEEGEIKNEEALVKIIRESLKGVRGEKITTKNVIAALPEKKSFLQVIQTPRMKEEDLASAIQFEAENYIPLPIEEVYLDFQIVKPLYDHLDHLDILLVASPKNIVDSYVSCLEKAGLSPQVLEIETQSIARALVKNEISLSPVLLIDFGKSATIFIIYSGRCLRFASTIPISSQHLTQAISKNMEIDLIEAEKLKLKYNLKTLEEGGKIEKKNIKNRKVFEAMIPVLSDMVGQIKRCVSYYHTHGTHEHLGSNGKKLEKIILCGKGANLEGLADFLSVSLKIPVEIGNPWINILPEPLKEVPELSFKDSLGYTTALGLALRGIRESN